MKIIRTRRRTGSGSVERRIASAALLVAVSGAAWGEDARGALDWGVRLRVRQEYLANVYDFSDAAGDDHNYIRVRPQIWGSWAPDDHWKLYAMLTNEHRHWLKSNRGLEDRDFEIHELIFESLWIEGKRLGGTPFGFILGRQNLFRGDGFVCWDGGPLDGSRTAYFNAIVFEAELEKRRVETHFISNPERDEYLPVWNDQDQALVEWKETGYGFSIVDESRAETMLEAYFFYKNERDEDGDRPEADVYTIGGRASGAARGDFSFAAEGAVQLGSSGANDRLSFSGNAWLGYGRKRAWFAAGGIWLSGDDPGTGRIEGWNPVYARWPKWSELLIYSLIRETGPAYWTNMVSGWLGADFKPRDALSLEGRLYLLWAPETSFARRGVLSTVKLGIRLNGNLAGHLLWESFAPGGYYGNDRDMAHFLRWELQLDY